MKKVIVLIVSVFVISNTLSAQKASDVLENGIRIKSENRIFLTYEDSTIKYYIAKTLDAPTNFVRLRDSTIFLANDDEIHIFLTPINPLKYSYKHDIKIITDPVDSAAASAIGSIISVLDMVKTEGVRESKPTCDSIFNKVDSDIKNVYIRLKDDKKNKIASIFKSLKELSFDDEINTIKELKSIKSDIGSINKYLTQTDSILNEITLNLKILQDTACITFVEHYTISAIIKDYESINRERKKRLGNLNKSFKLVNEAQLTASKGGDRLKWLIKLKPYEWNKGKLSVHTFTISQGSSELSDKKEIVSKESKDILSKTFRLRKYKWFVPEVSIGSAYTFFKYNSFGTTSDSTGQQFVASPTESTVSNINITTMLNFNLYIPNSQIHPLYQIGVGINSGIPTLFTGFGIRSNINGLKRIAISGGVAMTWIQELDKLNVGDKVTGTDDINKDLKYKFSWPPKAYIGIQYNF